MLRSTLIATDHGMLLTSLNMDILAVNKRFGEIFDVSPAECIELGMDPLRAKLRWMVRNPDRWMKVTNETYNYPDKIYEDKIELFRGRRIVLKRHSAPVKDSKGLIIGRLWTYRDITREERLDEIHSDLQKLSETFNPSPDAVIRQILTLISERFDQSTAILTMQRGNFVAFRSVYGPDRRIGEMAGNHLDQTFCQYALSSAKPVMIQNALEEVPYADMTISSQGFTRYLGVPVFDDTDVPVGTLCLIDGRSDLPLDDLDTHFLSLLVVRVSAELARERYMQERIAAKEREIRQQQIDLVATNMVFEAMNRAFSALSKPMGTDSLIKFQTRVLCGLLGYGSAVLLIRRGDDSKFRGYLASLETRRCAPLVIEGTELPSISDDPIGFLNGEGCTLNQRLQSTHSAFARRSESGVGEILIALGRTDQPPTDERQRVHLEAITDQVCLLLSTHVLQAELLRANSELAGAHVQLLQKEKLSVVGTLAASTAHDIRNITASLGLLSSPGAFPPEYTLNAIREQLGRFDVLAHRLLSYAKPRSVAQEQVDLGCLITNVIALTSAQARVAGVQVEFKLGTRKANIIGDPNQLEHLFVNLILNGIQSMDRKGGRLSVVTGISGDQLKIKIIDEGPGISSEIKAKLFEPFASSKSDGFGLGLYSCKRIVEAHGGTIQAKRNQSIGSTFYVNFPIPKAELVQEKKRTKVEA